MFSNLKKSSFYLLLGIAILQCQGPTEEKAMPQPPPKPRLLVTTDIGGDPDDTQSLIRLLLYANEFDIVGIVASASGTIGELDTSLVRTDLIRQVVAAYAQVQGNLSRHGTYPPASRLDSIVKPGNARRGWDQVGPGKDTEGSEWIIEQVESSDELLYVSIWGGQTDLAQALWKVKNNRTPAAYHAFLAKIRVHDIADQDQIYDSIVGMHPDLFYILNKAPKGQDKRNAVFRGLYLGGDHSLTSLKWVTENVLKDHGPLGALYPTKTWTAPNPYGVLKEGDTPSWFYFLKNGLNVPEEPSYGGWGGRFKRASNKLFFDTQDCIDTTCSARATVWRWRPHFQNHFQARMDWCVKDYHEANHPPIAVVTCHGQEDLLQIKLQRGETLTIDASKSYDPDRDQLSFNWYYYDELSDAEAIKFEKTSSSAGSITATGTGSVHLLLEISDNGTPSLVSYERMVITSSK